MSHQTCERARKNTKKSIMVKGIGARRLHSDA
ncbi:hypothetical protein COLO4_09856 [Corchorus olitorius]|uniref:Uncharacterized protein n=1 Tax=Corchorus olitorius TaxID=93759 RepID=A0A1R3KAW6_9ROSI|nr:hypothetical protein COLO4_09856 [Corchorus olitorius]